MASKKSGTKNEAVAAKAEAKSESKAEAKVAAPKLQGFVKEQIEDAQKKLMAFETEAQKVLENLIDRGQKSRKEVEGLLQRFNGVEKLQGGIEQLRELNPLDAASMKKLGKKANAASQEVRKRIEDLQNKVIEGVGVASQAQVKEINKELIKLSKKLDSLVGKKGAAKEVRN